MYIEPQTNIRLLKDVPLDTSYDHTIYFSTAVAQANYFLSKQKYNLINYTYQRVNKGVARVGIKADLLYDCNYMMFQNTAYGNKWFYAFITAVEYVNDVTANVSFEIDDMQTWHFDYTVDHCFVEREHVTDDTIGAHIEPETVDCGEYVFNDWHRMKDYDPEGDNTDSLVRFNVIIAVVDVTPGGDSGPAIGSIYDAIYSGAKLFIFDSLDKTGIDDFVGSYAQRTEAIISMYLAPKFLFGRAIPSDHVLPDMAQSHRATISMDAITTNDTIDGYTPKNKKLYTYPYNFFHIDNGAGTGLQLRYEFFTQLTPKIHITGTLTQPVGVVARPVGYKNIVNANLQGSTTEVLTIGNYPMCSWNTDAYEAWIAQNAIPMGIGMASTVVGGMVASIMNPLAGAVGIGTAIGQVSNLLSQGYKASIQADIIKGNFSNGNLNVPEHFQTFVYGRCSITSEYAHMIDDYFTMFGYGVKRCKVPNRNARPHWNYVKTVGCTLTGSVPADSMRHLCQIYDHGITFWNNGNEIGNYSLDNSIR